MTQSAPENRYHYKLIARALTEIDAAQEARISLSLEALAERLGMSPAHFQRVFSAWVGVSPKRYQQYLTLDFIRERLAQEREPLDALADAAGLSGTGRLHDLVLRWEAMTPGEFAQGAAGVTLRWGAFDTPFGPAIVMATERGICGMGFAAEIGIKAAFDDLARRWPAAHLVEDPTAIAPWVEAAFGGHGAPLTLIGAPFQIKVWEALLAIPSGEVTTYSDIATAIGNPRAVRAVGTAIGRNPISLLIPCHRALRKSGALGGYHWGLPVKRALLAWEAARADAGASAFPLAGS